MCLCNNKCVYLLSRYLLEQKWEILTPNQVYHCTAILLFLIFFLVRQIPQTPRLSSTDTPYTLFFPKSIC